MPIEVTMPRLSDTMEQGTVVKWNVKEGDSVSVGDVVADIETDKATMELEAFDEGTVAKVVAEEGQQVAVGSVILVIAEEGEDVQEAASSAKSGAAESGGEGNKKQKAEGGSSDEQDQESSASTSTAVAEPSGNGTASSAGESGDAEGGRIFVSPVARKMAEEAGLDLRQVKGTGPSGRIVKKDVEQAIESGDGKAPPAEQPRELAKRRREAPPPAPMASGPTLEAQMVPLSSKRGVIARRLVESKATIPHYQVTLEIDMDELMALRKQLNQQLESQSVKLSVNDFLIRACALAMHQHPFINSRWVEEHEDGQPAIEIVGEVNVGMAIALPMESGGGLVVGTLRHADQMGLRQISQESRRLAKKARDKGLSIEEMSDSTFTISNLGMFGVEHFTAIINPPNTAILAVGGAIEKAVVNDGAIVPGWRMQMTMSSDHRVIDGAMAAQYLATVRELLEKPATLLV